MFQLSGFYYIPSFKTLQEAKFTRPEYYYGLVYL